VESPDGWGLGSILGPIAGLERSRKAFSSRAKRMYLTLRETTSATLFYIMKHLLVAPFVI
jgi:hypothetical protein